MAGKVITDFIKMQMYRKGGAIATDKAVQFAANALEKRLIALGIDPSTLNNQTQLKQLLAYVKQAEDAAFNQMNVLSGKDAENALKKFMGQDTSADIFDLQGKKLNPNEPIMGGTQGIETLLKKGDITKGTVTKKSDKVKDREMFNEANERFNQTDIVADSIARITSMEPVTALKEANKIIKREGIYKNLNKDQSQAILKGTDDWINQRDPSDLYDYNKNRPFRDDPDFDPDDPDYQDFLKNRDRDDYYTGGMVDIEPNLSDIGHGADALMARTRLISPGAQGTTSTGLNYLLAEDNDNIRVPFKSGTDLKKRAFLKLMAALTGGIASIKSGLVGLSGKEAPVQVTKEVVKQSVPDVPPHFLKLVEKISKFGEDTLATQDKVIAKKYKDYYMEKDFAGNIEITKTKTGVSEFGEGPIEEVYMKYTAPDDALPTGKDTVVKRGDYEEFTARPDMEGKMKDVEDGVPDDIIEEVMTMDDTIIKKAEGGRIGFSAGKSFAKLLADKTITGSSRRFLEKVFGKESFENMIENDPELYRGLLETVEMFRKRDKEGLKMYMQKFLPHMDDEAIEDLIIGSEGTEGIQGQLLRLGSGRDYKGKLDMIREADQNRKLRDLEVTEEMIRKPNALGGRIGFSGGGIFRAIIAKAAAAKGMKPYEFIKVTSYKSLPREVKMFMSQEDFAKLKFGQEQMYNNYIDMMKTRKGFQEQVEAGKKTPASPIFEYMEKMMDEKSYVPKTVTADDIAEAELMVKNRFQKGRKDNAQGGLAKLLGE